MRLIFDELAIFFGGWKNAPLLACGKQLQRPNRDGNINVEILTVNPNFAAYDTRTIKDYEGPRDGPGEVSLTSLTDVIK